MFLFISAIALAQSDFGSIVGFAKDPSGAVIPNAKITLTNEGTKLARVTTTNASGYYVVNSLPPGAYTITAEAAGFKKFVSQTNRLEPNSTLTVDVSLTLGQTSETVEVQGSAVVLQTESAAVQNEVTGTQVQDEELNGRNPVYMVQFLPGVRGGGTIGDLNFTSTGGQSWQINGARTWDTLVTFDGAPAVRTRQRRGDRSGGRGLDR